MASSFAVLQLKMEVATSNLKSFKAKRRSLQPSFNQRSSVNQEGLPSSRFLKSEHMEGLLAVLQLKMEVERRIRNF